MALDELVLAQTQEWVEPSFSSNVSRETGKI
jgi:hypothetical protein